MLKMKGPFNFNRESVYYVPSKKGVFILADENNEVLFVGSVDNDLSAALSKALSEHVPASRFWYLDTWSKEKMKSLTNALLQRYPAARSVRAQTE